MSLRGLGLRGDQKGEEAEGLRGTSVMVPQLAAIDAGSEADLAKVISP